jgi:hypothetical protein
LYNGLVTTCFSLFKALYTLLSFLVTGLTS